MFVLLSLVALALLKFNSSLLSFTSEIAVEFQIKCVELSPQKFANAQWISAVVCGKNPARNQDYDLLQLSGLLHLIVVSGSHLVLVEQVLSFLFNRFHFRFLIKIIFLTAFAFMTGFQAPVVRALVAQLLNHLQNSWKLFWSGPAVTLFAGIMTLMMAPEWWNSLSLQLSWLAALALQAFAARSSVKQQFAIFVLMFPLLMQIAPPHPVSIIYNLICAPVVGLVMFPLSTLAMVFPSALSFVDLLWTWFFKFLAITLPVSVPADPIRIFPPWFVWIYIFTLNIFIVQKRQAND